MKITKIVGREILNSLGLPTIECLIFLNDDLFVSASVPSGTSKGKYEAKELKDNEERFSGEGVQKSVDAINNLIAPKFIGKEPNAVDSDIIMLQLDETTNKSQLGSNSILAVSMAMYKAHALSENMELYDFIAIISGSEFVSLPVPMINFINGGLHSDNNLSIQEYLVIPFGSQNIKLALENSNKLFYSLKGLLEKNKKGTCKGIEGGFSANFKNSFEPLEYISKAMQKINMQNDIFALGIDVAASSLYNKEKQLYNFDKLELKSSELINLYRSLAKDYSLISIEDGIDQDDLKNWIKLMNTLGDKIYIAGDDIFASNPERVAKGIEFGISNSVVIKPNQVGTVTEALQAIQLCQDNGLSVIVSHRSGETNDTFIVDLAVGSHANYIKCGGLTQGERIAKYNRLLEIENVLRGIDNF